MQATRRPHVIKKQRKHLYAAQIRRLIQLKEQFVASGIRSRDGLGHNMSSNLINWRYDTPFTTKLRRLMLFTVYTRLELHFEAKYGKGRRNPRPCDRRRRRPLSRNLQEGRMRETDADRRRRDTTNFRRSFPPQLALELRSAKRIAFRETKTADDGRRRAFRRAIMLGCSVVNCEHYLREEKL